MTKNVAPKAAAGSRELVISLPSIAMRSNPRSRSKSRNHKIQQIPRKQMSKADRLKKEKAVDKILDDLLCSDDDDPQRSEQLDVAADPVRPHFQVRQVSTDNDENSVATQINDVPGAVQNLGDDTGAVQMEVVADHAAGLEIVTDKMEVEAITDEMDVEDPIPGLDRKDFDVSDLVMLADVAVIHEDLKAYEV